jgi:hypothetical protein
MNKLLEMERRVFRTKILSRMRDRDEAVLTYGLNSVLVRYRRDSIYHPGEWTYEGHQTSDIEEVLSYLEERDRE